MNVKSKIDIDWALNQLIRGMGLVSSLTLRKDPSYFLSPKIFKTQVNSYFSPLTAFDSLLTSGNYSIAKEADPLLEFPTYHGTNVQELIWVVGNIDEHFNAGTALLNLISSDILMAGDYENPLNPNKHIRLTNPIPLMPLTWTLNPADGTFEFYCKSSPHPNDFVLTLDSGSPGLTLRGQMAQIGTSYLLGPNILRILELIGYRTHQKSNPSKFVPNLKFGTRYFMSQDAQHVAEMDGEMLVETVFN